uniref:Uncharacterized protein n=1 Tax=Parascaris univalens TaxID=6257 RepID=A0A915AUJ7_PARUN
MTRNTSGCETCSGMRKPLLDSRTSLLFPTIMQKLFEEFVEVDDTILAYLQCYGFRYLTKFFAYPIRIYIQLLKFCASLLSYITSHASNWFTRRLQKVVSFVLYEIDSRQKFLPFVLAELLESSQFEYSTKNQLMDYYKKAVNRSQSSDASSCLHEREPVIAENRKEDRLETFIEETDETSSMEGIGEDHDSISRVVDYMKHHDAVLAYYYTDDKKQMCMCEIFDMDHEDKRHECHSLLDLPN